MAKDSGQMTPLSRFAFATMVGSGTLLGIGLVLGNPGAALFPLALAALLGLVARGVFAEGRYAYVSVVAFASFVGGVAGLSAVRSSGLWTHHQRQLYEQDVAVLAFFVVGAAFLGTLAKRTPPKHRTRGDERILGAVGFLTVAWLLASIVRG